VASNELPHTESKRTHTQNYCKYHTCTRGAIFAWRIQGFFWRAKARRAGCTPPFEKLWPQTLGKARRFERFLGSNYSVNLRNLQENIIGHLPPDRFPAVFFSFSSAIRYSALDSCSSLSRTTIPPEATLS